MIAQGHHVLLRRGRKSQGAPDVHAFQARFGNAGLVALVDFQGILTVGVADHHQPLTIGQPGCQAITHAVGLPILKDSAFPVGHGEGFAACRKGHGPAFGVDVVVLQVLRCIHELAIALRA